MASHTFDNIQFYITSSAKCGRILVSTDYLMAKNKNNKKAIMFSLLAVVMQFLFLYSPNIRFRDQPIRAAS